jgi:hypothetical protein
MKEALPDRGDPQRIETEIVSLSLSDYNHFAIDKDVCTHFYQIVHKYAESKLF